ncbi:uncharacterized protein LAJ45_03800 [Morchella importuna]|uniref:uncharacterized protein n=1 Tax=Morchella importuna TaxID=1174673 RepID=UPI001E8DBA09|nr:uncharacterized protein LAJ45_03800 [Morchella importuna]KAH8151809.1 hypothetical protein LAJ45_03800 [Morchella importuna]
MVRVILALIVLSQTVIAASPRGRGKTFNPLEWVGANSPWFPGPDVFGISQEIPQGCEVDQAVYVIRHGSRYPDPGAYKEWQTLYAKLQSSTFTASTPLTFLPTWSPPALSSSQIAQVSTTGYQELHTLGTTLRFRYPSFYTYNTPFTLWANNYPRTIDSARLFSQGYIGPNATSLVDILVVNASDPAAVANSLAPSDLCLAYSDDSSVQTAAWDKVYLPSVTKRLQKLIKGNLTLADADVGIFPYLCGFETQILGRESAFCSTFEEKEFKAYEYRQDLRYWYGTGPGSGLESTMMLPLLSSIMDVLQQGPNRTYTTHTGSSFKPPPLVVAFTHDNQINQLASATGVFDSQRNLTTDKIDESRIFISSRINPMRGTVAFERLSCSASSSSKKNSYVRIRLNDAVYPVSSCQSGPGRSCPLDQYVKLVQAKNAKAGDFVETCGIQNVTGTAETTFFMDDKLEWVRVVKP